MRHAHLPVIAVLFALAHPLPAGAVELQPHRAVYRMVQANDGRNSDVAAANGVMIYRFARGCDGWTVENRTFLRLLYDNETEADTLWSFASWESFDGLRFRFHARYDQDGRTVEKLAGEAALPSPGGAGEARFSQPEQTIPLPAGTVFPTEHVRQIVAAAQSGRSMLNRIVFDGASVDNPYTVNAVFGPLPPAKAEALAERTGLPVQPAWWTRMAFFPETAAAELPEFEMGAEYRADGIADHILQTFETFSLDVRLKEIERLPAPDC